jgi:hypothetical protein
MNQKSETEMDLLLRRHARRNATGAREPGTARAKDKAEAPAVRHLDADELNAYAEGALTERMRTRYASHLADCDTCRRLVTELVVYTSEKAEENVPAIQAVGQPARSWRRWFAALLSPPTLRFAAPALALVAFAAVMVVVVTRNRDVTSFVAQNGQREQQPASAPAPQRNDEQTTGTTAANVSNENHGAPVAANVNSVDATRGVTSPQPSENKDESPVPPAPPPAQGVTVDGVTKAPEVAQRESQPQLRDQERSAEEQNAPKPGGPPSDKLEQRKEKDDAALAAKKRTGTDAPGATAGAATNSTAPVNGRRARSTETETAGGGGNFGTGDSAAGSDDRKKNEVAKSAPATGAARAQRRSANEAGEDAASTRSVAGRRFQRRNGAWVDTAYSTGRGTVGVKRGSEQYRALVADEPTIGTVTNELGVPVIVVVKGRAYHIY